MKLWELLQSLIKWVPLCTNLVPQRRPLAIALTGKCQAKTVFPRQHLVRRDFLNHMTLLLRKLRSAEILQIWPYKKLRAKCRIKMMIKIRYRKMTRRSKKTMTQREVKIIKDGLSRSPKPLPIGSWQHPLWKLTNRFNRGIWHLWNRPNPLSTKRSNLLQLIHSVIPQS